MKLILYSLHLLQNWWAPTMKDQLIFVLSYHDKISYSLFEHRTLITFLHFCFKSHWVSWYMSCETVRMYLFLILWLLLKQRVRFWLALGRCKPSNILLIRKGFQKIYKLLYQSIRPELYIHSRREYRKNANTKRGKKTGIKGENAASPGALSETLSM